MKVCENIGILLGVTLILAFLVGYSVNIWRLLHDSFEPPYKPEILRAAGIFIPPMGWIEGYMTYDDEKMEQKNSDDQHKRKDIK